MRLPRVRFTVRALMVTVAAVAVILTLELSGFPATLYLAGPTCGGLIHRRAGGRGIAGAIVGGCLAFTAYGLASYARFWFRMRTPGEVDLLGWPLAFLLLEFLRVMSGAMVGTCLWLAGARPWRSVAAVSAK